MVDLAGMERRTPPGGSRRYRRRSRPARRRRRRARAGRHGAASAARSPPRGTRGNTPGSQKRPALESSASTANCGATSTALRPDSATCRGTCWRLRTSRVSVASLPWKKTTMHCRPARIESARDVEQRAAVAVGLVLPVDAAARRGVAAPVAFDHVEERLVLLRHIAAIGERRDRRTARARSWPQATARAPVLRRLGRRRSRPRWHAAPAAAPTTQIKPSGTGAALMPTPMPVRSGSSTAKKAGIASR